MFDMYHSLICLSHSHVACESSIWHDISMSHMAHMTYQGVTCPMSHPCLLYTPLMLMYVMKVDVCDAYYTHPSVSLVLGYFIHPYECESDPIRACRTPYTITLRHRPQASSIKHQAASIKHQVSRSKHRAASIKHHHTCLHHTHYIRLFPYYIGLFPQHIGLFSHPTQSHYVIVRKRHYSRLERRYARAIQGLGYWRWQLWDLCTHTHTHTQCETWHNYMWDMIHSHVWHDSFTCVIWLRYRRWQLSDLSTHAPTHTRTHQTRTHTHTHAHTHAHLNHTHTLSSHTHTHTWPHTCTHTHTYTWITHTRIECVYQLSAQIKGTPSHVWHDAFTCVAWLCYRRWHPWDLCTYKQRERARDSERERERHNYTCVIWFIRTCEMSHFTRARRLIRNAMTHV